MNKDEIKQLLVKFSKVSSTKYSHAYTVGYYEAVLGAILTHSLDKRDKDMIVRQLENSIVELS